MIHALSQGSCGLLAGLVAIGCNDLDCRLCAGSADSASAWENWEGNRCAVISRAEFCAEVSWHKGNIFQTRWYPTSGWTFQQIWSPNPGLQGPDLVSQGGYRWRVDRLPPDSGLLLIDLRDGRDHAEAEDSDPVDAVVAPRDVEYWPLTKGCLSTKDVDWLALSNTTRHSDRITINMSLEWSYDAEGRPKIPPPSRKRHVETIIYRKNNNHMISTN